MFILDGNKSDSIKKTFSFNCCIQSSSPTLGSTTNIGSLVQDFDLVGFAGDDGKETLYLWVKTLDLFMDLI